MSRSSSLESTEQVGPGSYNTQEHKTIRSRTSPKKGIQVDLTLNASNSRDRTRLSLNPGTPCSSSFGTSKRSDPLERNFIKGGILFSGPKHEAPYTVGPGSYQDTHYKGSPNAVASTMLHSSFNVRVNQNVSGKGHNSSFGGIAKPVMTPRSSYKSPSSRTPKRPQSASAAKEKDLFGVSTPLLNSRPHNRDFIAAQAALSKSKSLTPGVRKTTQ